jgi:hypothetical protein
MSYLNPLRLHFAGQFQANVSTVNNDPAHFDNAAFQSSYQQMQGPAMQPPNGWFSPQGDAAFRLLGCKVTSAWQPSDKQPTGPAAANDPVLSCLVADSDSRVPAKLVDLDSEQQLVSEIWGLQVRVADSQGNTLLAGDFEPMAFMDLWDRALRAPPGSDVNGGAMYQSVLQNLQWSSIANSPFLAALRRASETSGLLSIKFNLDGINMDFTSPDFMCGRLVGTVGPAASEEPRHLVVGRQFMAAAGPNPNFFNPLGGINFCVGRVDTAAKCIFLDLGNALRTSTPGSGLADQGNLTLSVIDPIATPGNPSGTTVQLGIIPATGTGGYAVQGWYEATAGIVVLPLADPQLKLVASNPLAITGGSQLGITEWSSGAFVRADTYVFRVSPGETVTVNAFAMQWGNPLAGVSIGFSFDPSQLQPTPDQFPYVGAGPNVATPENVLTHERVPISTTPPSVTSDAHGRAVLTVAATDPGNVRWFNNGNDYGIDGQVYGVRPAFTDQALNTGPVNQWNFVSFLVWSGFTVPNPVTWQDLAPIFQQYANLYPIMSRFLDMGNYDSVVANAGLLQLAFGLNPHDPNSMPVTRDLSPAKRKAILSWLLNPAHPKGQPGLLAAAARPSGVKPRAVSVSTLQGGKSAAAARRLALQSA